MIKYFEEPRLSFGYDQPSIDPRDGLTLFGPYDKLAPYRLRIGVVGTKEGLSYYKNFVEELNKPIFSEKEVYGNVQSDEIGRPSFPGFQSVFNVEWPQKEEIFLKVSKEMISRKLMLDNKKKRTSQLVDLYLDKIVRATNEEDVRVDVWFIVVPRDIYKACKPGSYGTEFSKGTKEYIKKIEEGQLPIKFDQQEDYEKEVEKSMGSSTDFHHLMKARLILENVETPVQLILEPTLQFRDKESRQKYDSNIKAHLAWTQSTTLYYKLGKLPWKLNDIRDGVCYLGLIFKRMDHLNEKKNVCSAAQMFLKDGDGSVFRGSMGEWQQRRYDDFHLDREAARELVGMALDDYKYKLGSYPKELFIHGRAHLSKEEWTGFLDAVDSREADTEVTGVIIKDYNGLKLFRDVKDEISDFGVLRGLAYIISKWEGFLFTRGFIPRLNTASSLEVPNPLRVKLSKGYSDIETVISDVLALTKLNYNSCIYGDGLPVTLRFSDDIGNILTATKDFDADKRQFKYYI